MKTLVLGHGRYYKTKEEYDAIPQDKQGYYSTIRCSPIDINEWYSDEFTSVDMDTGVRPDIVYDLRKRPWTFAKDEYYDRVIDTCGIAFVHFHTYDTWFMTEVLRILKPGGRFYGIRNITVTKKLPA